MSFNVASAEKVPATITVTVNDGRMTINTVTRTFVCVHTFFSEDAQ